MQNECAEGHATVQPLDSSYKEIILHNGMIAHVDAIDYEYINQWKWRAGYCPNSNTWRAQRTQSSSETKSGSWKDRRTIYMHMVIIGEGNHRVVDHHDHNGLNNTRLNLRPCSLSKNSANRVKRKDSKTKYKGVCTNGNRWMARLHHKGVKIYLGSFSTQEGAARAYDKKAVELHGEFPRIAV